MSSSSGRFVASRCPWALGSGLVLALAGFGAPVFAQPASAPPAADVPPLLAAAADAPLAASAAPAALAPPSTVAPTPPAPPPTPPRRKAGRVQVLGQPAADTGPSRYALGINPPPRWFDESLTASLLVGLSRNYALHLAGGSYTPMTRAEDVSYEGSIKDVSVGVTYFPRRLWDGPTFEVGALARFRDLVTSDLDLEISTATRELGGQALVGWSWHLGGWAYVAVAVGGSLGYEQGEEQRYIYIDQDVERGPVDRVQLELESYLRFGLAFDK